MKIVISCHPTQGGSGIVATELATALAHRGHQVHLAAHQRPYRLGEDSGVIFHKVTIPEYPLFPYPPHDLSLANRLAGITRRFGIDIIHAHYAIPHAVTALLARDVVRPQRARVVTTLHGTDITLVGSLEEFFDLARHAMIQSDALSTVSDWLRDETMRRFRLPSEPEVIYNFVDTDRFHPERRVSYPDGDGEFHILHASNLRPVKRIADTVRVFHGIRKQMPAHLTILGEGPEKGTARELVTQLGLCGHVTFDSTADDVPAMMRSAHLVLMLSDYESFGLSALEAMACGTPVLASDSGGLPEVIDHGRTGILTPVGDVETAVARGVALLKDQARWQAISAATAEDVRARFTLQRIVPHYEALYERVMKMDDRPAARPGGDVAVH